MGTTEQWVVANEASASSLEPLHAVRLPWIRDPREGWAVWRLPFEPDLDAFEQRLVFLVSETSSPAMSIWIQDSDFALIVCGTSRGELDRAMLRPDAADSYAEARAFIDRMPRGAEESLGSIARWLSEGPRPMERSEIEEAIDTPSPFVNDAVLAILSLFGFETSMAYLSSYEGLRLPFEGKTDVRGREVDLETLPYFMGSGRDAQGDRFVGIWKRGEAGPPIETFPAGEYVAAHLRVLELSGVKESRLRSWFLMRGSRRATGRAGAE